MSGAESCSASDVMHWDGGGGPLGTAAGSNQYGEVSYEADLTAALSPVSSLTFAFVLVAVQLLGFSHKTAYLHTVGSIKVFF